MRISKLRATTAEWCSAYPWHFGASIPAIGPIIGVDVLSGGTPFGLDPFAWVNEGVAQNPNMVISGAPANGKSALVKLVLWWLVGAFGCRFVATDVKGEYRGLAEALDVPVLDLHPGGSAKVNPLDDTVGRLEFATALAALCLERPLSAVERATLSATVRLLPKSPLVADLVGMLRDMPATLCDELTMPRGQALDETKNLRFGFGELLSGANAGMFDGHTNVDLAASPRGFVVDVSGCGTDDRTLRFALLTGMRAADQLVGSQPGQTLLVNDESWRLAGIRDTVVWLQHSFKLGRQRGQGNIIVVHRLAELGGQTDGATGEIASRLVSDADTHILFRQGDQRDAADTVERIGLPESATEVLARLPPYRCLIHVRDQLALVDVKLTKRVGAISDTNTAMRAGRPEISSAA